MLTSLLRLVLWTLLRIFLFKMLLCWIIVLEFLWPLVFILWGDKLSTIAGTLPFFEPLLLRYITVLLIYRLQITPKVLFLSWFVRVWLRKSSLYIVRVLKFLLIWRPIFLLMIVRVWFSLLTCLSWFHHLSWVIKTINIRLNDRTIGNRWWRNLVHVRVWDLIAWLGWINRLRMDWGSIHSIWRSYSWLYRWRNHTISGIIGRVVWSIQLWRRYRCIWKVSHCNRWYLRSDLRILLRFRSKFGFSILVLLFLIDFLVFLVSFFAFTSPILFLSILTRLEGILNLVILFIFGLIFVIKLLIRDSFKNELFFILLRFLFFKAALSILWLSMNLEYWKGCKKVN